MTSDPVTAMHVSDPRLLSTRPLAFIIDALIASIVHLPAHNDIDPDACMICHNNRPIQNVLEAIMCAIQ